MVVEAAKRVWEGSLASAFVLSRPPGHHNGCDERLEKAVGDKSGDGSDSCRFACHGGCILNETAVAIRTLASFAGRGEEGKGARARGGHEEQQGTKTKGEKTIARERETGGNPVRSVVLDLDIHYGDGTAWIFYEDPCVLHVSLHLDQSEGGYFPFLKGKPNERGQGAGAGYTLNLPLLPGMDDRHAEKLLQVLAYPAIARFEPDIVFISLGFDGMEGDPTESGVKLTEGFYARAVQNVKRTCSKVVVTVQGGYQPEKLADAALAVLEALTDNEQDEGPQEHHRQDTRRGCKQTCPEYLKEGIVSPFLLPSVPGFDSKGEVEESRRLSKSDRADANVPVSERMTIEDYIKDVAQIVGNRKSWWHWEHAFDYGLDVS